MSTISERVDTGRLNVSTDCVFCQREDPDLNRILCENDGFYARYDNFPVSPGHMEIVPKRHVESFFDLLPDELIEAFAVMQEAQDRLEDEFHPAGYNIGINEGAAAGRTVDHLHIHLIPRFTGDVEDPRGGIRQLLPGCSADRWAQ